MMILSSASTALIQETVRSYSDSLPVFVMSPAWIRMSHFGKGVRKIGAFFDGIWQWVSEMRKRRTLTVFSGVFVAICVGGGGTRGER